MSGGPRVPGCVGTGGPANGAPLPPATHAAGPALSETRGDRTGAAEERRASGGGAYSRLCAPPSEALTPEVQTPLWQHQRRWAPTSQKVDRVASSTALGSP